MEREAKRRRALIAILAAALILGITTPVAALSDVAQALHDRGRASLEEGDLELALADFDQAIALAPKYADAYHNRGIVHFYRRSFARAKTDFKRANELEPMDAYSTLWLYLAERRSDAPSSLLQASKHIDMQNWPAPIIRLFLGRLNPAQTLAAAEDPNPKRKQYQVCEANFYVGEFELLRDARDEASRLFRLAANGCPPVERLGATLELKSSVAD
jgi:lipoprotein NlpI